MQKLPTSVRQAKNGTRSTAQAALEIGTSALPEQAALHHTRLALARWRADLPQEQQGLCRQAQWHAQQQEYFLAWLNAGGFSGQDDGATAQATIGRSNED